MALKLIYIYIYTYLHICVSGAHISRRVHCFQGLHMCYTHIASMRFEHFVYYGYKYILHNFLETDNISTCCFSEVFLLCRILLKIFLQIKCTINICEHNSRSG